MQIQINGVKRQWEAPVTVLALLNALGIDSRVVAVEKNLRIVPREEMAAEMVREGDALEIVRMMGGG
jgi:sulfur carrier protein